MTLSNAQKLGFLSASLFLWDVLARALKTVWWLQPLAVLVALVDHVTEWVKWFATLLANVCIWIGWHLRDVFEALGPAFRDSFRDLWRVAIGSVPTWFFTYVDVFGQTIEAAAALVAPWITWIAATLVTVLVSGLGYWIFFVRTRLGPRCIEAIALRCCGEAGPAENEPVVLAPMARTTRRSGTQ